MHSPRVRGRSGGVLRHAPRPHRSTASHGAPRPGVRPRTGLRRGRGPRMRRRCAAPVQDRVFAGDHLQSWIPPARRCSSRRHCSARGMWTRRAAWWRGSYRTGATPTPTCRISPGRVRSARACSVSRRRAPPSPHDRTGVRPDSAPRSETARRTAKSGSVPPLEAAPSSCSPTRITAEDGGAKG